MTRDDDAIRYHDALAGDWEARYRRGGFRRRARFVEARVLRRVDAAGAWLDAGCGSGTFSRLLARQGARVTGVDGAREMIRAAEGLGTGPDLDYRHIETVEALPFADASFDGVLSLSVIEYLNTPERAVAEFARVLRPGGRLVVSVPNRRSLTRALQAVRRRLRPSAEGRDAFLDSSRTALGRAGLDALLRENGFAPDQVLAFDALLPGWAGRLSPGLFFAVATRA